MFPWYLEATYYLFLEMPAQKLPEPIMRGSAGEGRVAEPRAEEDGRQSVLSV